MNACTKSNISDAACNPIPLNLRNVAYCNAMANAQNDTQANEYYAFLLNKYYTSVFLLQQKQSSQLPQTSLTSRSA